MSQDTIQRTIRSVQRAWFEDGVWEIGFGLAFLLVSFYSWLVQWFDLSTRLGQWQTVLQMAIFVGAFGAVRWVMGALKQRFTFPRTGYAAYRRPTGHRRLRRAVLAGIIGAAVGAMAAVLRMAGQSETCIPALLGLALGGWLAAISIYYGLMRFLWMGLLTLAWGGVVAWLRLPADPGVALLMSGFGVVVLLDGALALTRFIRRYPLEPDEALE